MWVRGLKHLVIMVTMIDSMSHLMWVRGLKLQVGKDEGAHQRRTLCGCVD